MNEGKIEAHLEEISCLLQKCMSRAAELVRGIEGVALYEEDTPVTRIPVYHEIVKLLYSDIKAYAETEGEDNSSL